MDYTADSLPSVLILLASGVLAVVLCRSLRLPPMVGYLVTGLVLGPHALGLASDREAIHTLAEFGVVFLMFSIGLEFSLPKLIAMRRVVFGLGARAGRRQPRDRGGHRARRRRVLAGGRGPRRHRGDVLDRHRVEAARRARRARQRARPRGDRRAAAAGPRRGAAAGADSGARPDGRSAGRGRRGGARQGGGRAAAGGVGSGRA